MRRKKRTKPVLIIIFICTIAVTLFFTSRKNEGGTDTGHHASAIDSVAPYTIEPITPSPQYRYRITTTEIEILPPHDHHTGTDAVTDAGHGITVTSPVVTVPEDMWVTGFTTIVHNAPYTSLHHSALWRTDEKHPICDFSPDLATMRHIYTSSNENVQSGVVFPAPYGFFLPKGTPLLVEAMLHNAYPPMGPGEIYKNVSVEVQLDFERPHQTDRSKPLEYFQLVLEDAPCDPHDSVFTVPANTNAYTKYSTKKDSAYYTFTTEGVLVMMGTHLHPWEGGKYVQAYLNGALLATIAPQHASNKPWSWLSPRLLPFTKVNAGDTVSLSATYGNPHATPVRGAMGMISFYFAPLDQGLIRVEPSS